MTGPTFLVAGGARCGTTALVEGLRAHPRIFVTQPKEPHYFALHGTEARFSGPSDDHTINRVAVTNRESYLRLYPSEHDYLALGEGSVSTLYYVQDALPEVVRMNPRMKVVVLLREPVARAFSAHQYMCARGVEPEPDFLRAVELEQRRREQGWHHIWHYTAMSRYAPSMEHLVNGLPPEQLGVWFYDDLDADYGRVLGEVLRFLGVPPITHGDGSPVPRVNVSGQPRIRPLHATIRWATRHERIRSTVKRTTSFRFRERIRRATLDSHAVPWEARELLGPLFADDLLRLRDLLDQPLPPWLAQTPEAA